VRSPVPSEALNTIQGVKEVNSSASEGSANVRVTFNLDADWARHAGIRAKVGAMRRQLPRKWMSWSFAVSIDDRPIMSVVMQRGAPCARADGQAEEVVKTRFESVTGVGDVSVTGGTARQIRSS
jgi:HAE1 family hydrophobic/amphiphilic exporter-1